MHPKISDQIILPIDVMETGILRMDFLQEHALHIKSKFGKCVSQIPANRTALHE